MKKLFTCILISSLLLSLFTGCNQTQKNSQNQTQSESQNNAQSTPSQATNSPEKAVSDFLKDLQHEDFSSAKANYVENLDNMANFRNQIESISPSTATQFFSKLADFTYTVESTQPDSQDSSKATVYLTMTYYDVGKAFETTILDYIRTEISMTYDGKNDEDIMTKADEIVAEDIKSSTQVTTKHVPVSVVLEDTKWKVEKMSKNPELLNVLSGNIMGTISELTLTLQKSN